VLLIDTGHGTTYGQKKYSAHDNKKALATSEKIVNNVLEKKRSRYVF